LPTYAHIHCVAPCRGCLGTGDLQGRLSPYLVGGDLELRDVVQVSVCV
jgi:hypothetical protein